MSPAGFLKFLDGSTPYPRTAAVLVEWYQAYGNVPLSRATEPPREPVLAGIGEDALRAALRRAVDASSIRIVAEQVGLTPRGLQLYMDGEGRPRDLTLRKLREWYLREAGTWTGTREGTARAAIAVLVDGLPRAEQDRVAGEIADAVRGAYERVKLSPPQWLAKMG